MESASKDLSDPPEADAFREKARAFLDEYLPADWKGVGAIAPGARAQWILGWRTTLQEAKLLAPHWPAEYGVRGSPISNTWC